MKKAWALPLLILSPVTFAQSYINVGMGFLNIEFVEPTAFSNDSTLIPTNTHTPSQVVFGTRSGNRIIEIGYRVFRTNGSNELENTSNIPALPSSAPGGLAPTAYSENWSSELNTSQWSIKLLYGFNTTKRLTVKAGIGAIHSRYSLELNGTKTWQDSALSNAAYSENNREKFKQEHWGWLANVGFDYVVWPAFNDSLTLGVDVTYSEDEYATILMPMINVGWRF